MKSTATNRIYFLVIFILSAKLIAQDIVTADFNKPAESNDQSLFDETIPLERLGKPLPYHGIVERELEELDKVISHIYPVDGTSEIERNKLRYFTDEEAEKLSELQYKLNINNYDAASDFCFERAQRMCNTFWNYAVSRGLNPLGSDGVMGTNDDRFFKIVIQYPQGSKWSYHIALGYLNDKGEIKIVDPIRGHTKPYPVRSKLEKKVIVENGRKVEVNQVVETGWVEEFAHGARPIQAEVSSLNIPQPGTVHYGFYPMTRYDINTTFPDLASATRMMQLHKIGLDNEIKRLELRGRRPYPSDAMDPANAPLPGTPRFEALERRRSTEPPRLIPADESPSHTESRPVLRGDFPDRPRSY